MAVNNSKVVFVAGTRPSTPGLLKYNKSKRSEGKSLLLDVDTRSGLSRLGEAQYCRHRHQSGIDSYLSQFPLKVTRRIGISPMYICILYVHINVYTHLDMQLTRYHRHSNH